MSNAFFNVAEALRLMALMRLAYRKLYGKTTDVNSNEMRKEAAKIGVKNSEKALGTEIANVHFRG